MRLPPAVTESITSLSLICPVLSFSPGCLSGLPGLDTLSGLSDASAQWAYPMGLLDGSAGAACLFELLEMIPQQYPAAVFACGVILKLFRCLKFRRDPV